MFTHRGVRVLEVARLQEPEAVLWETQTLGSVPSV